MRISGISVAMWIAASGAAMAQGTNHTMPGSLAPTTDPGCIVADAAPVTLTPPDLGLGVRACAKAGDFDRAVGLFILMQLRARYDTLRVADETAHQGEQVLSMETFAAMSAPEQAGLQAAFGTFGDTGSPRHVAFCAAAAASGPPDYTPVYMIQHGITAFTGIAGDGLVPGFDAPTAWPALLVNYLKCQPE